MICRTVNYEVDGGKYFNPIDDPTNTARTKNYLVYFDKDFNLLSRKRLSNTPAQHEDKIAECRGARRLSHYQLQQ